MDYAKFLPVTIISDADGNDIEGFKMDDIKNFLNEKEFDEFCAYIAGKKVQITPEGASLVYTQDWDEFANRVIPEVPTEEGA